MRKSAQVLVISVSIFVLATACNRQGAEDTPAAPVAAADLSPAPPQNLLSATEVTLAIEKAWSLLTGLRDRNPLINALAVANEAHDAKAVEILTRITGEPESYTGEVVQTLPGGLQELRFHRPQEIPPIPNKDLNILEHGACSGPLHEKDLTSITAFDETGQVCVSVDEGRRLDPQGYHKTLFLALVHQVVHMHGYGEAEANYLLEFLKQNWKAIIHFENDRMHLIQGEVE